MQYILKVKMTISFPAGKSLKSGYCGLFTCFFKKSSNLLQEPLLSIILMNTKKHFSGTPIVEAESGSWMLQCIKLWSDFFSREPIMASNKTKGANGYHSGAVE